MTRPITIVVAISIFTIMITFDDISDANSLYESFRKLRKTSKQKTKTHSYSINLLDNVYGTSDALRSDNYRPIPTFEYLLNERGRQRDVKVSDVKDGVVQRCVYDRALLPVFDRKLIYDNGASREGKGISHARKRIVVHLSKYYRQYQTNDGWCLRIDFRKYFDNIRHKNVFEIFDKEIDDEQIRKLLHTMVSSHAIDVSSLSDSEAQSVYDNVYNAIDDFGKPKPGEKHVAKSLGIGNPISQMVGLALPIRIDNYCKIVRSQKYYGRYMDDTYIISHDKDELKDLLEYIREMCKSLGIFINEKKTQIYKLSKGFTFLKCRYVLTATGKVLRQPSKDRFVRERRKIKKWYVLMKKGQLSFEKILQMYLSWRGTLRKEMCYKSLCSIDTLFSEIYKKEIKQWNTHNKRKFKGLND